MSTMRPRDRHAVPAPLPLCPDTTERKPAESHTRAGITRRENGRKIEPSRTHASEQAQRMSFARRWRAQKRYDRARRVARGGCRRTR